MPRTPNIPIRLPLDLVTRIDALRGLVAREAYVRHLLVLAVEAEEQKAAQS